MRENAILSATGEKIIVFSFTEKNINDLKQKNTLFLRGNDLGITKDIAFIFSESQEEAISAIKKKFNTDNNIKVEDGE